MSFSRVLWRATLLLVAGGQLWAQDSTSLRQVAAGFIVDFQDADIRTVITTLAEAGAFNVSFLDLPAKRVTLRLRQPVPRSELAGVLRSLAASSALTVTDEHGILRFEAAHHDPPSPQARDAGSADMQLFIYPLRHAKAAALGGLLQNIFSSRGAVSASPATITQVPLSQRLRNQQIPQYADSVRQAGAAQQSAASQTTPSLSTIVRNEVQILPDETNNALLIRASSADWAIVRKAIVALDLRPLQVLIEVVIAEVRVTTDLELGVSVAGTNTKNGNTISGTLSGSAPSDFVTQLTRTAGAFSIDVALAALRTRGNVRILSRPMLLAQNNKEAKILVGSQRPFIQVSRSLPTDNGTRDEVVQYRDVGTSLSILPTINPDGYVNLQVVQEVSSATSETQFGAPVISTREAQTQLFVRDGQTGVLGGLVDRETDKLRGGIPFLSSIPLLGALFGSTSNQSTTTELFLFLTPHVMATDEDTDRIREQLNGKDARDATDGGTSITPLIATPPSKTLITAKDSLPSAPGSIPVKKPGTP